MMNEAGEPMTGQKKAQEKPPKVHLESQKAQQQPLKAREQPQTAREQPPKAQEKPPTFKLPGRRLSLGPRRGHLPVGMVGKYFPQGLGGGKYFPRGLGGRKYFPRGLGCGKYLPTTSDTGKHHLLGQHSNEETIYFQIYN